MKKRKQVIGISIAFALLVIVGIVLWWKNSHKANPNIIHYTREETIDNIAWMGVAEDGISTCIVQYGTEPYYDIVPGKYIVCESVIGTKEHIPYCFVDILKYEQYDIYVYDIETKEKRFVLDMLEILEEYPGMQFDETWGCCYVLNGQYVLQREFRPCPTHESHYSDEVDIDYINIYLEESGYTIQEEETESWSSDEIGIFYALEEDMLLRNNLPKEMVEILEFENGMIYYVDFYQNFEGVYAIRGVAEALPVENEVLYGMFPELEQYRGEENCYIYMLIGGNLTAEELLRLYMEDGQEISFEGAMLPELWSIDGKVHEIHSFKDFNCWSR